MSDNSSIVDFSIERVKEINDNTPKLAQFFYVNAKRKVNYYRRSSFGSHFEVFNKGTNRWEYAAAVTEDRLRKLPAISQDEYKDEDDLSISQVLALGSVAKAEAYAASVENTPVEEAEVVVTNILCNTTQEKTPDVTPRPRGVKVVQEVAIEPKKEEGEQTILGKQLDTKTLTKLMRDNLHPDFLLKFTPQERNYYIVYDYRENQWDYSSVVSREMQIVGVTYTNSLRCVELVVKHLNENNYSI